MTTAAGGALEETNLLLGGAAESLAEAYVYPNPYRGIGAAESNGVYFAALPRDAVIRIYALNGVLLKTLKHNSDSGHEPWDLRTANGEQVASGVYLYAIDANGDQVMGKLAVVR